MFSQDVMPGRTGRWAAGVCHAEVGLRAQVLDLDITASVGDPQEFLHS